MTILNPHNDQLLDEKRIFLQHNKKRPMKSIINLYGALVRKKDFEGSKKSILNRCSYLVLDYNFIKKLLSSVSFTKSHELYNKYLGIESRNYSFRHRLKIWLNKCRIPFPILRLIAFLHKENEIKILIKIINKIKYVTDRSGKSSFKPPIVLGEIINEKRLYEIGFTIADGDLYNHQQELSDGSSSNPHLSEKFFKDLKFLKIKLWGLNSSSIYISKGKGENKNMWQLSTSCKSFVRYLNFVYSIPFGKKSKIVEEPKIFKFISKSLLTRVRIAFYRGVFDGDGSLSTSAATVSFSTSSKKLALQTKNFLESIGVYSDIKKHRKDFTIYIKYDYYKKFAFLIGSYHPNKIKIILKRLKISPKRHICCELKKENFRKGYFDFTKLRGFNKAKIEVVNKESIYLKLPKCRKVKLPIKPTQKLLQVSHYLIPQNFNKLLIMREGINMTKNEFDDLLKDIRQIFDYKISVSPCNNAHYLHSTALAQFFLRFFKYDKDWHPITESEEFMLRNKFNLKGGEVTDKVVS